MKSPSGNLVGQVINNYMTNQQLKNSAIPDNEITTRANRVNKNSAPKVMRQMNQTSTL